MMAGMNQMNCEQIIYTMEQNPMIKNMIYTYIQNPFIMNQVMNIINILNNNILILNQIKAYLSNELSLNVNNNFNMPNNGVMMNQPMMINNFKAIQNNNNKISLIFNQRFGCNEKIAVTCLKEEKISEIIQKYRNKSGDFDLKRTFIFGARKLNPSLTVMEQGLNDLSTITVYN